MMDAMEAVMVEQDWQARARQRQRRINTVIGALFAVGLVCGFLVGFFEDDKAGLVAPNSIPPWLAVTSATVFIVAVSFGSWKLMKESDEHERVIHTKTTVIAGNVMLIGFPAWFVLWKGGLVPQPDALWLFMAGIISSALAFAWYKFR